MLDAKIETFLKVVELKSYTAAAQELHMTQPAVTQHIRKLEAYYGCMLIDSARHTVKVTEAGELLYEYLSLQCANQKSFSQLLFHVIEPLRVGATLSIGDYYLPNALVDYMLTSDTRIRVEVGNTQNLLKMLRTGKLDCAFIEGLFDPTLLDTEVFCEARFLPIVSSNHPLLGKQVTLNSLHEYQLVLREPSSGTREVFETWLRQNDDTTRAFSNVVEFGSFILIKHYLQRTNAITFVYEGVVRDEISSGKLCPLDIKDFDVTHNMHFVYRKGDIRHSLLKAFFKELTHNNKNQLQLL